jgi:hypothetical protein
VYRRVSRSPTAREGACRWTRRRLFRIRIRFVSLFFFFFAFLRFVRFLIEDGQDLDIPHVSAYASAVPDRSSILLLLGAGAGWLRTADAVPLLALAWVLLFRVFCSFSTPSFLATIYLPSFLHVVLTPTYFTYPSAFPSIARPLPVPCTPHSPYAFSLLCLPTYTLPTYIHIQIPIEYRTYVSFLPCFPFSFLLLRYLPYTYVPLPLTPN